MKGMGYYPTGMSKDDLDYIEGSDEDLQRERWEEQHEAENQELFFAEGNLDDDYGTPRWEAFLDKQWELWKADQ